VSIDNTSAGLAMNMIVDATGHPGCNSAGCASHVHISNIDFGSSISG